MISRTRAALKRDGARRVQRRLDAGFFFRRQHPCLILWRLGHLAAGVKILRLKDGQRQDLLKILDDRDGRLTGPSRRKSNGNGSSAPKDDA